MRAVGAIFLAFWLTVSFSQPALAVKRVALIIGNSAYQNVPRLSNPMNDLEAMSSMLRGAGFDIVDVRRDLKANEMRRALRDFADKVRDADVAIVYFAGHGIEIDGVNYVIPIDAVLERDIDAFDEAVPLDRVLTVIDPAKQLRLVILDACRDNPFGKSMRRTIASRAIGRGLAKIEPTSPNTLIAFAAKAGSTASDGDSKNSPFTAALVRHLPKPGLDLRKAFGFTRDDVLKATNNKQEPYVYGSLGGDDFPLVVAKPVATGPQSDPQASIRRDYELALQAGERDAWEAFLQTYPDGFYANLAKVQLKKIAAEEARAAAAEKARLAEQEKARLAAEGARQADQAKASAAAKVAEEARIAAERTKQIEQEKAVAAEKQRLAEEARLAAEKVKAEEAAGVGEQARIAAEKQKAEGARKIAEAKATEQARIAAEKQKAEEVRLAAEKAKAEEAARVAEQTRIAAEKRKAEEARKTAEAKAAEQARIAAEKQKVEDARLAAEKAKAEEVARIAEQTRIAAEKLKTEEAGKIAGAKAAEDARIAAEKARAEESRIANEKAAEIEGARIAAPAKEIDELRLAEAEKAKDDRPIGQVASLAPQDQPASSARPVAVEVPRLLQDGLRRVGCYTGAADGSWNAASQRALELFKKHTGMKFDVKVASVDALDAVQSKSSRVCPLICEAGYKVDGDNCVKIACRAGLKLKGDGTCEKFEVKKPTAKRDESKPRDEPSVRAKTDAAPAKPQATGQIVCTQQGCTPLAKGCRLEMNTHAGFTQSTQGVGGSGAIQKVVCN